MFLNKDVLYSYMSDSNVVMLRESGSIVFEARITEEIPVRFKLCNVCAYRNSLHPPFPPNRL